MLIVATLETMIVMDQFDPSNHTFLRWDPVAAMICILSLRDRLCSRGVSRAFYLPAQSEASKVPGKGLCAHARYGDNLMLFRISAP